MNGAIGPARSFGATRPAWYMNEETQILTMTMKTYADGKTNEANARRPLASQGWQFKQRYGESAFLNWTDKALARIKKEYPIHHGHMTKEFGSMLKSNEPDKSGRVRLLTYLQFDKEGKIKEA